MELIHLWLLRIAKSIGSQQPRLTCFFSSCPASNSYDSWSAANTATYDVGITSSLRKQRGADHSDLVKCARGGKGTIAARSLNRSPHSPRLHEHGPRLVLAKVTTLWKAQIRRSTLSRPTSLSTIRPATSSSLAVWTAQIRRSTSSSPKQSLLQSADAINHAYDDAEDIHRYQRRRGDR